LFLPVASVSVCLPDHHHRRAPVPVGKYATIKDVIALLKQVDDPERFGVAELSQGGRILGTDEKPHQPQFSYVVTAATGIDRFDNAVFDIIDAPGPSHRGEVEISGVNNVYIHAGTGT
jgi:glucose-1-phosphate thymidylyltransferase